LSGPRRACEARGVDDPLRMHVLPELRDAPLVVAFEGWNDAGEAASTALSYLQDAIHAVPLAEIDGEDFLDFTVARPAVRLDDGGARAIDWPCMRFAYGSVDASREIVVGSGPEPHLRWRRYCDTVAELVGRLGIRRVVLLGAFLADVVYSRPVGVTGFASHRDLLDELGVQPSGYQGPTGIVGVLADRLRRDDVEIVSLWAGLPHYISVAPNPRGAFALVQKLTECLGIKIDEQPLRGEAAHFEQRVSAIVAADPELGEYVRQLKRREFAQ
jgi:predicted ATP-grasp superfamily ATP-dependent carboligase